MFTGGFSILPHCLIWKKCVHSWMSLYLLFSVTSGLMTVNQAPVVVTELGHSVTLPCEFSHSPEDNLTSKPILYWEFANSTDLPTRLFPNKKVKEYQERVECLDLNQSSPNKSIRLRNIQWQDSAGKYICKVSVKTNHTTERKKGNGTILRVYDSMVFNTTGDNDQLRCDINVSQDPGFILSVAHGGLIQTRDHAQNNHDPSLPYVKLSVSISLRKRGEYECLLHLNSSLILKKIFLLSANTTYVFTEKRGMNPEPWLLYVPLLLVPLTMLLALLTALLVCTHRANTFG